MPFAAPSEAIFSARLSDLAAMRPQEPAIRSAQLQLNYAELDQQVSLLAAGLLHQGLIPNSAVELSGDDEALQLIAILALMRIGCRQTSLVQAAKPHADGSTAGQDTDTRTVHLGERELRAALRLRREATDADRARWQPSQARLVLSTSGTTGAPKLVVFDDANLLAQAPRHIAAATVRLLCPAHIENNFAKRHRLFAVAVGACNIFHHGLGPELAESVATEQVNYLHLSAFQARSLLAEAGHLQLPDGGYIKIGGSPVTLELRRAIQRELRTALYVGYGTTETGAIAYAGPDQHDELESVGRPLPGVQLRLQSADGSDLAPDAAGEIQVACEGRFLGYAPNLIDDPTPAEGKWLSTGDIGQFSDDGRLCIRGRADDMFVFNSMNIYPEETERLLLRHPQVSDVAVLPRPSPIHGQIPVALVQGLAEGGLDLRDIQHFARQVAGPRAPRKFVQVPGIPRNHAGKIDRRAALALFEAPQ